MRYAVSIVVVHGLASLQGNARNEKGCQNGGRGLITVAAHVVGLSTSLARMSNVRRFHNSFCMSQEEVLSKSWSVKAIERASKI
jgi:hypothetical protein